MFLQRPARSLSAPAASKWCASKPFDRPSVHDRPKVHDDTQDTINEPASVGTSKLFEMLVEMKGDLRSELQANDGMHYLED